MKKYLVVSLLVYSGCKPDPKSYDGFLGDQTNKELSPTVAAAVRAVDRQSRENAPEDFSQKRPAVNGTVSSSELTKIENLLRECRSKLSTSEANEKEKLAAEYVRGETSCHAFMDKEMKAFASKFNSEADKFLADVKTRLSIFSYRFALVNGLCAAKMVDGRSYEYRMRNVCANVVNKIVSGDGEVIGISKAVSAAAMKEGISEFECSIGKANIVLLAKNCDESAGVVETATAK